MDAFLLSHAVPVPLGFAFGIFAIMAVWILPAPLGHVLTSLNIRWNRDGFGVSREPNS